MKPVDVEPNLFLQMESEREGIPHMLREDYIPIFIVNQIREHLCKNDESTIGKSHLELMAQLKCKNIAKDHSTDPWTDDSFIEEFTDFENSFLLPENSLEFINRLLSYGKEAMDMFNVDFRQFWKCFVEEMELPNLELLWLLDSKYQLLSLSSYLMMLKQETEIQSFKQQFLSFCTFHPVNTNEKDRATAVLEHILQTFLISAYCNPGKEKVLTDLQKMSLEMLNHSTAKLVQKRFDGDFANKSFIETLKGLPVPASLKKKYFSHQLARLLTDAESSYKSMTLNEVLQCQERFIGEDFLNETQQLGETMSMMTSPPMLAGDVLQVITESFKSPTKKWDRILRLITEWLKNAEFEASTPLKEIIRILIREGLSSRDEEKVALAFILARHCSLVAPKIFSRYERWYSNIFESEKYSPARDPDIFNFFTNLLTSWIPFEPSGFLQVQASFWPYIPTGCRSVWSDYVSLAKCRVAEYNEVEGAMECVPNPNNPLQYDVEMVIKAYENTRSIPKNLAHMWMFRKQYFIEQFLPTLLKIPIGMTLSDARLRLIEVLNKDGKIPHEMYSAYKDSNTKFYD